MSTPFITGELAGARKSMKAGKAPGPDDIHPEFLLHAGDAATKWLCQDMSTCLERCKIRKIRRKTTVIALPKPNKPKDDPKDPFILRRNCAALPHCTLLQQKLRCCCTALSLES